MQRMVFTTLALFLATTVAWPQEWGGSHEHDVHCLAFSADGTRLATGSLHNQRKRAYPDDDKILDLAKAAGADEALARRSSEMVRQRGGEIKIWDVAAGRELRVIQAHNDCVSELAFSPDGKSLASANKILIGVRGRDNSCEAKLWEVETGRERATLAGHRNSIVSLAFSPDGSELVTADYDGDIRIWNSSSGEHLRSVIVSRERISAAVRLGNLEILAVASQNSSVTFWNTKTGKRCGDVQSMPGHAGCAALAASPDGTLLAAGLLPVPETNVAPAIQLWQTATVGEDDPAIVTVNKAQLAGHAGLITALAFSSDGTLLASGSADKSVRLWRLSDGKELSVLKGHSDLVRGVAFAPRGNRLASIGWDGAVLLWRIDNRVEVRE